MSQPPQSIEVDLIEDGLLWLINSTVLHPRGFALGVDQMRGEPAPRLRLFGDGTEPWQYATKETHGEKGVDTHAKFDAVRDLFERAARENGRG